MVGPKLVRKTYSSSLLAHIEENTPARLLDHGQGAFHLLTTIAAQGVEDITRQAFRMDPDQSGFVRVYEPCGKGHMFLAVDLVAIGMGRKLAKPCGEFGLGHIGDQALMAHPVFHQVRNGHDLKTKLPGYNP